MTLEVEFAGTDQRVAELQPVIESVLAASIDRLGACSEVRCGVTVLLADTREISRLHAQFFGDPSDTDVMSFPGDDMPSYGGRYLGDVAISLDVARIQAAQEGHSLSRELAFLALHGLLHLLGYSDDTESERDEMLRIQTELLEAFEDERGCTV